MESNNLFMDWSVILNFLFGTGLVATIVGLFSIRSELKRARAEAEKAMAEADAVKITNTENATRILMQNIVEPLREELNETRKDLAANKREMARFRKAVEAIPLCPYHAGCPVLCELSNDPELDGSGADRQPERIGDGSHRANKRGGGLKARYGDDTAEPGPNKGPASGRSVHGTGRTRPGIAKQTPGRDPGSEREGNHPAEGADDNQGQG